MFSAIVLSDNRNLDLMQSAVPKRLQWVKNENQPLWALIQSPQVLEISEKVYIIKKTHVYTCIYMKVVLATNW